MMTNASNITGGLAFGSGFVTAVSEHANFIGACCTFATLIAYVVFKCLDYRLKKQELENIIKASLDEKVS